MDHFLHSRDGHQSCAPSWTLMVSSASNRSTSPSGRTLPSSSIIFVLELKLVQQLKTASPMTRPARSCEKSSPIQLIFEMMMKSIEKSEFLRQTSLCIKPTLMMSSPKSRRHQTTLAKSWCAQPRQDQSQIITSVVFIRMRTGLNLGDFFDFATAEVIA